ncbi:MAG: hypothetical protein OEL75_02405, partial [Kiritimatiellaceae bacterium]|nr:hypothetical protein [Kiritimatiellaceae bacterium]
QGKNGVRFEQVISPRDATATEIPSIAFSYFDSGTGTYRTIQSPAIPITVTASSNNTAQVFAAQETLVAPPSNQPFATQSDVQRFTEWLKQTWDRIRPWLWTLPATLGVGILIFLARKFYHYHRKDTVRLRRQQAPKAARKALRAANKALHDNNLKAFYGALGDALTSYFGNRLNLTPGNVTPTIILTALKPSALHPDQLQDLQNIFEQLEAIRYGVQTQKQSAEEMTALKIRIEKTLRATEKLRL